MYHFDFDTAGLAAAAGIFGGIVRWYERVNGGHPFRFWTFIVDMMISSVMGLAVFWVAHELGQPPSICACAAGFAGNVGSRSFDLVRSIVLGRLNVREPFRFKERNDDSTRDQK